MPTLNASPALAQLLREAAAAHHRAFAATDGADREWPAWYASYLASPLGELLGRELTEEELAAELRALDREYRVVRPAPAWPDYYAARFLQRHG